MFEFRERSDSVACAIASKPEEALILYEAFNISSGKRKKKSGINSLFSKEYFIPFTYITALDVTSAPDPAVVGTTTSFVNFFLIGYE